MSNALKFRERYRAEHIGRRYSGPAHLAFTITVCTLGVAWSVVNIHAVTGPELWAVPMTFLYANLAEYWGHRGPMHHSTRGLTVLFRRHVGHHHRFFDAQHMAFDNARDYKAVLFPPVMIAFFTVAFAVPYWLLLRWAWSDNAAWLGVATALAYFLNYELLHFIYHCAPDSPVRKLPGVAALRRLHHAHHDPQAMSHRNFNITYPIGDWLFGTLEIHDRKQGSIASGSLPRADP